MLKIFLVKTMSDNLAVAGILYGLACIALELIVVGAVFGAILVLILELVS